jgi:Putative porin
MCHHETNRYREPARSHRKAFAWKYCASAAAAIATGFCASTGRCDDAGDPLLDLLIKKGIVTQDEAAKIKAESEAARTNAANILPESKWKISQGIKSVELFGDLRGRFEDRQAEDPYGGKIDLQRLRYAARVGLHGDVYDDFYYGVRLETASNPRSPWVTFGTSAGSAAGNTGANTTPYQGPFGKSTAGINVGQLYIGWRPPGDWAEFTFGAMPNPLYTTPMIWDTDLNPAGFAEHFKYTVGPADFFLNLGQFLYQDTNPEKSSAVYFDNLPYKTSDLPFLLAWQGGFTYHFSPHAYLKVAPVLYTYLHAGVDQSTIAGEPHTPGFAGVFMGQGATNNASGSTAPGAWSGFPGGDYDGFAANQTGINDLQVLDIPAEFDLIVNKFQIRAFGDYAENLEGVSRANAAYNAVRNAPVEISGDIIAPISSPQTGQTKAYQFGLGIGSTNLVYGPSQGLVYGTSSGRHAWELRGYWQHTDQYALDPNLVDSDFFEGRLNLEGFYLALAYSLTDNIIGTVRYGHASRIDSKLGTGGSNQDIPQMNPIDHYHIFQADLTFRF